MTTGRQTEQLSFSQAEYESKKKQTRRDLFLAKMESVVPWVWLIAVTGPHYPKSGKRGRPPIDATLIAAPSSTKNEKHEHDPDMHQTKKGNRMNQ